MTRTNQIYTLEDLYAQRFAPLSTLNLERVSQTIQAYGEFLARDMNEQLDMFTEETTVSRAVWGGAANLQFDEVGEFGKGKTNKDTRGQELHFPLFKLDATVGGSEEFWKRAGVKDLIDVMNGMDNAYAERVRNEVKAAIFNKSLHVPVKDWLVDNTTLNKVQPFLNADSNEIPVAPNGTTFTASSHNHYLGITGSSLSMGDVDRAVSTVREHVLGKIVLFVDGSMPATLLGLSGTKYVGRPPSPIVDQSTEQVARLSFNPDADRNNMSVGYWDGHEVITRSWVPTGYIAVMAIGGQLGKPLWRRVDPKFPGLITGIEITDGRIRIKESYFYMGFGSFNRAAGAVLDTVNATYTNPSGLVRS
jgi:hypothetical protein